MSMCHTQLHIQYRTNYKELNRKRRYVETNERSRTTLSSRAKRILRSPCSQLSFESFVCKQFKRFSQSAQHFPCHAMMLDSREINDIECRALAMLKDHSLLNPARNSRKSNKSKPCRRDQHDTRTEKLPDRSSNLKDDRNSSDDGPYGLVPDTAAKNMDVAQTASPGHAIRPNRRSTRLSALQPCQEKVKKRKREAHKQEKRKSRRSMTVSTEYKARQDLDEGDADGTKLKKEYKRGELLIHGEGNKWLSQQHKTM